MHTQRLNLSFLFLLLISFPLSYTALAQEQVVPLTSNSGIQTYLYEHPEVLSRHSMVDDTLVLPFVDDFSRPGIYPFDSLWADSNVYINTSFCDQPVTIGVATFDGLDKYGRPHDSLSGSDEISDYLTSRPIDMGSLGGDTGTVWLSFFYQPQGLGDIPETEDSLVLQLKDKNNSWNTVWSVPGHADTLFQRANIHIRDTAYFYKGFQFRFYNIATINGNRDHWNLDYVILNKQTAENDSIPDNAMIRPPVSLLVNYTAMPYSHYKNLGAQQGTEMVTEFADSIHDINYGQGSVQAYLNIFHPGGLQIYSSTTGNISANSSNSYIPFSLPVNSFTFPTLPGNNADFTCKAYFTQTGSAQTNTHNDTCYLQQRFRNYYSYDDGTAEISYGVTGNTDVMLACKYDVKQSDTLLGIRIYFNPSGTNVHNKLFQLAYWYSVDVTSNTDSLVYKMIDQKPYNVDSINGFATYLFDQILVVPAGNRYFGFIQNDPATLYGIGLDRNTDFGDNKFYHVDGHWYRSQIDGSWMIRPMFGDSATWIGVPEVSAQVLPFTVYPNPSNGTIRLAFSESPGAKYEYTLFDILGKELEHGFAQDGHLIRLATANPGLYFVRLTETKSGKTSTQKFSVR